MDQFAEFPALRRTFELHPLIPAGFVVVAVEVLEMIALVQPNAPTAMEFVEVVACDATTSETIVADSHSLDPQNDELSEDLASDWSIVEYDRMDSWQGRPLEWTDPSCWVGSFEE